MTGSMYASVAGLRAHMQKLTVIGNNVANVNTAAYKKQRTVFRDSIYSMYTSGSDGTTVVGGKNPSQLGYGSLVANIDLNMTSATYNPGNPLDCAIAGDGFFLVGDKELQQTLVVDDPGQLPNALKSFKLTRVGDFQFKPDGYLSDGQGNVVYGFQCIGMDEDGNPIMSDQLVGLRLPKMEKAVVDSNTGKVIEPNENGGYDTAVMGTDGKLADGYEWSYTIRYPVNQSKATDNNTEATKIPLRDYDPALDGASAGNNNTGDNIASGEKKLAYAELESIQIDSQTGCISGTARESGDKVIVGYLAMGIVQNPNGVSHIGSSYYQAGPGAGDLRVSMLGGAEKELGMTYVNGELYTSAGDNGTDNETTTLPDKAQITSCGDTELMPGFLEGPNVDLAEEITELITTQRGYQANTRIVTVTDSMLEELVNMKR